MKLPKHLEDKQTEDIEVWLINDGYKLSQIEWMFGELHTDIKL